MITTPLHIAPHLTVRCVLVFLCGAAMILSWRPVRALGQDAADGDSFPKLHSGELSRRSGPQEDDTTGSLASRCGSYVRGSTSLSSSFTAVDGSNGRVSVEVVRFPKGYPYGPHDLFGLLWKAAPGTVKFHAWEYADGSRDETVCSYSYDQNGGRQKGGVVWFHGNVDEGVVTVVVGYTDLNGAPRNVIDGLLLEYPSNVPANPTWHIDWETKDLEKWAELLRTYKDDLPMLQAAAAYLMRYDKHAFGLLDALEKRDDAAAYSQALEQVSERLIQVAEERKSARDQAEHSE